MNTRTIIDAFKAVSEAQRSTQDALREQFGIPSRFRYCEVVFDRGVVTECDDGKASIDKSGLISRYFTGTKVTRKDGYAVFLSAGTVYKYDPREREQDNSRWIIMIVEEPKT